MQYKLLTCCAIKALWFLAEDDRKKASTYDLAEYIGMSRTTVQNIMRTLRRNTRWIESFAGTEGGYRFVGDAAKISLYDIHKAMEDEMRIGNVGIDSNAALDDVYGEFVKSTKKYFAQITLKDLLEHKTNDNSDVYVSGFTRAAGDVDSNIVEIKHRMDEMKADYEARLKIVTEERDRVKAENTYMYNKVKSMISDAGM